MRWAMKALGPMGSSSTISNASFKRQISEISSPTNLYFPSYNKMADPELEAIRQRRMQELMGRQGGGGNSQNPEQQKAQEDAKRDAEERRQLILTQILTSEARERLARIALVKPEKARSVEDLLIRAAQTGQINEKVTEEKLISFLEQINTQTSRQTKVTIQRRRFEDDD